MVRHQARGAVSPELQLEQSFYRPLILEFALTSACNRSDPKYNASASADNDPLLTPVQVFHSFLNKMAQNCDNRRGGRTVTSLAILQRPTGPEYVFGSNRRSEAELEYAKDFVASILNLVGQASPGQNRKPLLKKVLWEILTFNLPRVNDYLSILGSCLDMCIEDCERHRSEDDESVMEQLLLLRKKLNFPRDMASNDNAKSKFLSDCESVVKAAVAAKDNKSLQNAILQKAKDGETTSSRPWCELRHYLGRWRSFRQAADAIVSASNQWPGLFQDFVITWIPSSRAARNPVRGAKLTAAKIIRAMRGNQEHYLAQAEGMQNLGLDELIQIQENKKRFRPLVHAEVLLHTYLLDNGITYPSEYWNSWKCIGTSKPTCRLCGYYFSAHPDKVQVRPGHQNLYPSWRLPDIGEDQPREAVLVRNHLMLVIMKNVWTDAKRTLTEKSPRSKTHDSNTYSGMPDELQLEDWSTGAESEEDDVDVVLIQDQGNSSDDEAGGAQVILC